MAAQNMEEDEVKQFDADLRGERIKPQSHNTAGLLSLMSGAR